MSVVALLTDFGLKDGFVGAMKGVILSINPQAQIVDISHQVEPFNVLEASLLLKAHYKYFPKDTVFVCVVDPGVGSERLPLAVRCGDYSFVGPNNGVFDLALKDIGEEIRAYKIENFTLPRINQTFHGRDVFAPVSAWLSMGVDMERIGPPVEYGFLLSWGEPAYASDRVVGKVVYFDRFGNAITNVPCAGYKGALYKGRYLRVCTHFLEGEKGALATLCGSFGYMEIFTPLGSARELGVSLMDEVVFLL